MLPPDSRTTLLKKLEPPPGYSVTHVVGTTCTLDLDSALLPSLALSRSAAADSADRLETIAAVQASIGKIEIFHQVGQINVSGTRSRLHTLLEPAVHGVRPANGFLFHPKVWIARYEDPDNLTRMRMLVLSRNLSRSKSWDVAVTLEGWVMTTPKASNRPIADFVRFLPEQVTVPLPANTRERLTTLADEIRYVEWELPAGAKELDFHVFGLPGRPRPKIDFTGYKHLIISPFLTDDGFAKLVPNDSKNVTVVSRQEALDGLSKDNAEWISTPYVLSPTAGIPAEDEESTGTAALSGLHAKLYCVERARNAHLFIGSANATYKAFNGNVEILVELTGGASALGVDRFLSKDGLLPILEETTAGSGETADNEAQVALDAHVRAIASLELQAVLTGDNEAYDLRVTSREQLPSRPGVTVAMSLYTDKSTATQLNPGAPIEVAFGGLQLSDVTAFLVIVASDTGGRQGATIVKCNLINDVPGRMDSIVTNEINNPDDFRRFLSLLLAFGAPTDETEDGEGQSAGGAGKWHVLENGLFEQLLKTATLSPESLERLAGVVTSIIQRGDPHHVLPDGFADLWAAISSAADIEVNAHA